MTLIKQTYITSRIVNPILGISGYLAIPNSVISELSIDIKAKYCVYSDSERKDILYFIKDNKGLIFKNSTMSSKINILAIVKRLKIHTPVDCIVNCIDNIEIGEGFFIKFKISWKIDI